MAGTVTVVEAFAEGIARIEWTWTSSAGGAADLVATKEYFGVVLALQTTPGAGGAAPSAAYDITITDPAGFDVLLGAGADRSAVAAEGTTPASASVIFGAPTLHVTNAGNAKSGTVVLYIAGAKRPQA